MRPPTIHATLATADRQDIHLLQGCLSLPLIVVLACRARTCSGLPCAYRPKRRPPRLAIAPTQRPIVRHGRPLALNCNRVLSLEHRIARSNRTAEAPLRRWQAEMFGSFADLPAALPRPVTWPSFKRKGHHLDFARMLPDCASLNERQAAVSQDERTVGNGTTRRRGSRELQRTSSGPVGPRHPPRNRASHYVGFVPAVASCPARLTPRTRKATRCRPSTCRVRLRAPRASARSPV